MYMTYAPFSYFWSIKFRTLARSLIDWYARKAIGVSIFACIGSLPNALIDIHISAFRYRCVTEYPATITPSKT